MSSAGPFKTCIANSVNSKRAVWSGSTLFVCMPKLDLDISIYMTQMTSAGDIFRCIFFLTGEGLIVQSNPSVSFIISVSLYAYENGLILLNPHSGVIVLHGNHNNSNNSNIQPICFCYNFSEFVCLWEWSDIVEPSYWCNSSPWEPYQVSSLLWWGKYELTAELNHVVSIIFVL